MERLRIWGKNMVESKISSHKKEIRRQIRQREQELSPETKRKLDELLGKRLLTELLRLQGDGRIQFTVMFPVEKRQIPDGF